jgi:4-amino-4-deoxy-L-arabinose transferase-like glycosyltransferase
MLPALPPATGPGRRPAGGRVFAASFPARLAILLGGALILRLGLLAVVPVYLFGDPSDYHRIAASIAAGHGFPATEIATPGSPSAFHPPGYPYLLGAVYAALGDHPEAGRLLGALLGVLTVGLLVLLARTLWSERVGLLAGALAALFLPLAALDTTLLSETLFLPVELAVALSLVRLQRSGAGARAAGLSGALIGVAALVRESADLWLLAGVAVVAVARAPLRRRAGSAAVCVAAAVVVVAPWMVRNALVFHTFVPISTETGYMMAGQYNEIADRGGPLKAVWHLPTTQAPDVERAVSGLFMRRGGVEEPQLDGALRDFAVAYEEHHPLHLALAVALNTLRLFDLGPGHSLTSNEAYRELDVPPWLRLPSTLSLWLVTLLAVGALLGATWRRRGAEGRRVPRLGPWWLWSLPLLDLLVTVPLTGAPVKRLPLDPFLVLLAALAVDGLLATRRGRPALPAAAPDRAAGLAVPG